jgi:hypothetical protein
VQVAHGVGSVTRRVRNIDLGQARAIEDEVWRRAALVRPAYGGRTLRTLRAFLRLTVGYRRTTDDATAAQLGRMVFGRAAGERITAVEWEKVSGDLRRLTRSPLGVAATAPVGRPSKVEGRRYRLSVETVARDVLARETPPESGALSVGNTTRVGAKVHPVRSETPPESGGHSLEAPREPPRERESAGHVSGNGTSPAATGPPLPHGVTAVETTNDNDGTEGGEVSLRDELVARWAARVTTPAARLSPGELENTVDVELTAHGPAVVELFLDWLDDQERNPDLGPPRYRYPRDLAKDLAENLEQLRYELAPRGKES